MKSFGKEKLFPRGFQLAELIQFLLFLPGITCAFLLLNVLLIIIVKIFKRSKHRGFLYDVTPLLAWLIAILQLFLQLIMKGAVTPR